jgi:ATP-dependent helicase/nuclease subunit A
MMMRRIVPMPMLTKAQAQAVRHRQGNVLVSAGAGSGKTMVLTQRVLTMVVDEGLPLERLLILTFTNAAANAMKEKIRHAFLSKQKFVEANQVDQAYIMTFDAFALFLVKKYHTYLGVDANVAIYEETLYDIEKRITLEQIFLNGYVQKSPPFIALLKQFVIQSDNQLKEFILKIDHKADLKADKQSYYKSYLDDHFSPQFIDENISKLFQYYRHEIELIQRQASLFENAKQTEEFNELCSNLLQLPTLDDLLLALKQVTFQRLKPKSLDADDMALRKKLKEDLQSFKMLADMVPMAEQRNHYDKTKPYVEIILKILEELQENLNLKKQKANRYPFTDIAKLATSLFQDDQIRKTLQDQFEYIMVDEYQDTNDLQEAFLSQLAKDNLFMVGDIKQSIYRFRNANSDIFNDKLNQYQPYDQSKDGFNTVISLNDNFRSRKEVLHAINDIFAFVMTPRFGGVLYDHRQQLDFGQTNYETQTDQTLTYDLSIMRYATEPQDKEKHEPRLIARDIKEKITLGVQVVDETTHRLRPATYKDFAILIDRKTNFESFLEVFNEEGIPLDVFAERDLSDSDFFRVIKNLIGFILLVRQDEDLTTYRHLYVSVLRSFLFQVKDEDIHAYVFNQKPYQSSPIFHLVQRFQPLTKTLTLYAWIQQLFTELQIEKALLTLPDLPSNLARLEGFLLRANQLTEMGYTVDKFYTFLQESKAIDVDLTITAQKESDNSVQLMTIHKSKGLEFPIVYYPGLTKGFNMMDTKGMFHVSMTYGIQLPYPDATYAKPLLSDLILNEESEAIISEQVRLFYVALTRAKEKIILVLESSKEKRIIDMDRARSFSDFIHLYHLNRQHTPDQDDWKKLHQPMLPPIENQEMTAKRSIEFDRVSLVSEILTPKTASKPLTDEVDESLLDYGTYLHECMYLMDFKTLDVSFIPNPSDRMLIEKLLNHDFFRQLQQQVLTNQVMIQKEYAFFDETTQRKGIMDLFILRGNQVTIVDYKTDHIDDPLYVQQLQQYAMWMHRQNLQVSSLILISLRKGLLKNVAIPQPQK